MQKTIIRSAQAPAPIGPYSQAVKAGNTLYVSGQIALDAATGNLIKGSLTEETHRVMQNLEAVLKEAGMTFKQVVKCSIFLMDMNDFGTVNEEYGKWMGDTPPARETVQVSGLPKGVRVEISCIAVD